MTIDRSENECSLWSFSVDRYAKPGVQDAALALQENQGADVNFVFYCAWCAFTGRDTLDVDDFGEAEKLVARWREEITKPLRALRDRVKTDPELAELEGAMDVRGKILSAEVESERIAQIVIESTAGPKSNKAQSSLATIAESNLKAYLTYINADVDEETKKNLEHLLSGIFSD